MIKNYQKYILESNSPENNSIGEYIENLSIEDEFIRMIANQMTKDVNPSIRLSNAINLLDDLKKVELLKRVENYLNGEEAKSRVSTIVDIDNIEGEVKESYGKSVVNTFFKCLTALGFKENSPETKETPSDFLLFFKFSNLDSEKVKVVFNRFKSLQSIHIEPSSPTINLYFGIKCDGIFEYGYYVNQLNPIGFFKLTKSIYNQLKLSDLKATSGLKKALVNLNFEDITLMSKIKMEMLTFNPGYTEQKMAPQINDRVITFGYYGCGKWDNGQLDEGELENIKSNLKTFLIKYRWVEKVMINVYPSKFWVYIQIKLK